MTYTGLFALRDAQDLLKKLRFDLQRLETDPLDVYAAFDFFVTARHFPEWLHPHNPAAAQELIKRSLLLQICAHIADGAKHFEATNPRHESVAGTEVHHGVFSDDFSELFDVSSLVIHLQGAAAEQMGPRVSARSLARSVLAELEPLATRAAE